MSHVEFSLEVECPYCGNESTECAEFNLDSADQCGCKSDTIEVECWECCKKFWYRGYLEFNTEVTNIYLKKPKVKP